MSDFYKVKIESVSGKTLRFTLWIINSDVRVFPLQKVAALFLICEPLMEQNMSDSELGKIIGEKELFRDIDWFKKNASKFITSIELLRKYNFPVSKQIYKLKGDEFRAFWENDELVPRGEYVIKVKDASFLTHIKAGDEWESAASDL